MYGENPIYLFIYLFIYFSSALFNAHSGVNPQDQG